MRSSKPSSRRSIDVSRALRVPGAKSSASLIMIDASGEKMIATRRNHGLSEAVPEDPEGAVADADAAMLDNRYSNISLPICRAAKARNLPRVLDFDKPTPPDDPLLQCSSHVICSADAIREATGETELPAALKKLGQSFSEFLAVTNGPDGVYWLDRNQMIWARFVTWMRSRSMPSILWGPATHSTAPSRSGSLRRATLSTPCVLPPPPPQLNAPASAG